MHQGSLPHTTKEKKKFISFTTQQLKGYVSYFKLLDLLKLWFLGALLSVIDTQRNMFSSWSLPDLGLIYIFMITMCRCEIEVKLRKTKYGISTGCCCCCPPKLCFACVTTFLTDPVKKRPQNTSKGFVIFQVPGLVLGSEDAKMNKIYSENAAGASCFLADLVNVSKILSVTTFHRPFTESLQN